jgi:short-subunit dehydrogenase
MSTAVRTRLRNRYGPWAVVTGASDGIGRESAIRLAEAGFSLVLAARRKDRLDSLASQLVSEHGILIRVIPADLTTQRGVDEIVDRTRDADVGLLVAAAGYGRAGLFVNGRLDEELEMIDLNCRAVAALTHAFGRRFVARRRGGIVLMSSLLAFQGVPGAANYAATKAYVQSFAEALHVELKPLGVDVIASAPGPIHSGFAARASMKMALAQSPRDVAGATLASLGRRGTVRPGWLSKFLEGALALLPRWGRVRVMRAVMAGMTEQ